MPHIEAIRSEVQRLLRAVPFRPFALNMESGDCVIIEHPENIAFDPASPSGRGGSEDFHGISNRLRLSSTFHPVIGVSIVDTDELENQPLSNRCSVKTERDYLQRYPCQDYFASDWSHQGFWDESARLMLIVPAI